MFCHQMNPCQLAQAVHRAGHETTNFVVRSKVKVTLRPKIDLRLSPLRGVISLLVFSLVMHVS